MGFNGKSLISVGVILFIFQIANFISIETITPELERAQVLAAIASLIIILIGFIFIIMPTSSYAEGINNINKYFITTQQKSIINYEKSQPSSIDNPVVDPNFNVMRENDTANTTATYIVIGLLIVATLVPLATWWYFSK